MTTLPACCRVASDATPLRPNIQNLDADIVGYPAVSKRVTTLFEELSSSHNFASALESDARDLGLQSS